MFGRTPRRRARLLATVVALSAAAVLASACEPPSFAPSKAYRGDGTFKASNVPKTVTPGSTLTIDLKGTTVQRDLERPGRYMCVWEVVYQWYGRSPVDTGLEAIGLLGDSPMDISAGTTAWSRPRVNGSRQAYDCDPMGSTPIAVKVPAADDPLVRDYKSLRLVVSARTSGESVEQDVLYYWRSGQWDFDTASMQAAAPATAAAAAPVVRMFPAQAPADAGSPALVDARLSTDPLGQTLSFAWDLNGDGVYGDATDGGSGATPDAGLAYVSSSTMLATLASRTQYQPVGLKLTAADGRTTTKVETIRIQNGLGDGSIATPAPHVFAPAAAVAISLTPPANSGAAPGNAVTACVDTNGDDVYGDGGPVSFTDVTARVVATIAADATIGLHRISAVFWANGYNADCANTGGDTFDNREHHPYIQVVSALYTTSAAGARQVVKEFRAAATLRTLYGIRVVSGTTDRAGITTGTVIAGAYRFRTPAAAKGVKRPPALAQFASGPYAMRIRTSWMSMLVTGDKAPLITEATMLIKGADGSLACLDVRTGNQGSGYTLTGGTKSAARLSLVAAAPKVVTAVPRATTTKGKPGKASPAASKPKLAGTRGAGTIVASSASSRPLPSDCKALVRYLP